MLSKNIYTLYIYALSALKRFQRDTRGASIALVAAAIVPLVGFAGMAVDTTRGYILKSQLSYAIDAAGLAGGRELFSDDLDQTINTFFDANFPDGYMGSTLDAFDYQVDVQGENLTITASATIETTFMKVLGQDTLSVAAATVVQRSIRGMELALVMDVTGSMRTGGKMDTMKSAATDLLAILFSGNETVDDFWVSLVPFTATVNIGGDRFGWVDNYDAADFPTTAWKGCVRARDEPFDQNDDTHNTEMFQTFAWPSESGNTYPPVNELQSAGNSGTGPNLNCGPAITSLTDSYTEIQAAVDELNFWRRGGTMGNLGLAWGWRTLSPKWRNLWGGDTPAAQPFDYDEPLMDKVVVMLTDGNNQWAGDDYTAYGKLSWGVLGTTSYNGSKDEIDDRMLATCTAMKAAGIKIFTITFQVSSSSTRTLYENCATSEDHYFNSPDNATLSSVFKAIGTELSNLRIAQ